VNIGNGWGHRTHHTGLLFWFSSLVRRFDQRQTEATLILDIHYEKI